MDWSASGSARVAQNVLNLINTYRYEVAFNRIMGVDTNAIDSPTDYAIAQLKVEVRELISRFEPRAIIRDVICQSNQNGDIEISVIVDI